MKLRIVTPEGQGYDGPVEKVSVPGRLGAFQILKGHAPIVSLLDKGTVAYTADGRDYELGILGGFVEVQKDIVSLCVECGGK